MPPAPNPRLTDNVVLITGAASGIGAAVAKRLSFGGAKVALADVSQTGLKHVAESILTGCGHVLAIRLDVTSEADWATAISGVLAEWGRLDILVNCAGIALAKPITELALADWRRVMQTNLDGVFLGTKAAMDAMRTTGGGCIIQIASAAGIKPLAGNAAYGTSKAAIRYFTQIAALEGKPHGVRVNSISPGAVATPMWRSTEMWPGETEAKGGEQAALDALVRDQGFSRPEEVAAAVMYLMSDEARHITGVDLVIDDGFSIG